MLLGTEMTQSIRLASTIASLVVADTSTNLESPATGSSFLRARSGVDSEATAVTVTGGGC